MPYVFNRFFHCDENLAIQSLIDIVGSRQLFPTESTLRYPGMTWSRDCWTKNFSSTKWSTFAHIHVIVTDPSHPMLVVGFKYLWTSYYFHTYGDGADTFSLNKRNASLFSRALSNANSRLYFNPIRLRTAMVGLKMLTMYPHVWSRAPKQIASLILNVQCPCYILYLNLHWIFILYPIEL